ncbi:MAG TPA: SprT family zinc-dependent metalloprotease [Candidatus Limnocylindrales bacterium]|nr:SprT family zinc-dependent metalloprotease [Candidatus Limnocylindrales bacterium]
MSAPGTYTVRRSTRAHAARLIVRPDGEVVVTLPLRAPERWAERLVAERAAWIEHHRARLSTERARLAARPALGQGRALSFGGVAHELVVASAEGRSRTLVEHPDAEALEERSAIRVWLAPGDERPPALILERWLRGQARTALQRRIAIRSRDLGVEPRRLSVRDQRSRWGSASRRGTISFSWRLILAPAAVLDYVVVHELAHLRYFGHGPRFWALVRRHVPEADVHRRWLRTHDADLRHALD